MKITRPGSFFFAQPADGEPTATWVGWKAIGENAAEKALPSDEWQRRAKLAVIQHIAKSVGLEVIEKPKHYLPDDGIITMDHERAAADVIAIARWSEPESGTDVGGGSAQP